IEHLAHEYSGHDQLVGLRNVHSPKGISSTIGLKLDSGSSLVVEISPQGGVTYREDLPGLLGEIRKWDLMRTVLRQDKVAHFIHRTKGEKYADILPLLGLLPFETAAENLRQLAHKIVELASISSLEQTRERLSEEAKAKLGALDPI